MNAASYYTAIVVDVEDPDELGRLRLIIPELYGDGATEYPGWIPPRVPAGAGAGAGWWFVPPVDSIVLVERTPAGDLRWTGGTWGQVNEVPAFLAANYPRRSGFTSPEGGHSLAMDEDTGILVLVTDPDDPDGVANFLSLDGSAMEAKIGLASGTTFMLTEASANLLTGGGTGLFLDDDNGATLAHADGAELLSVGDGVILIQGTDLQIMGGTINAVGGTITLTSDSLGIAPTEPLILGTSFLTDLATFLTGCVGDVALSPGVAAAAGVLLATVNTALGAGAPYLSTVSATE